MPSPNRKSKKNDGGPHLDEDIPTLERSLPAAGGRDGLRDLPPSKNTKSRRASQAKKIAPNCRRQSITSGKSK